MTDDRLARARGLLAEAGVTGGVSAAGSAGEILAVRAGPDARQALAGMAPAVRALGFRYVALELGWDEAINTGNP